MLGIAAGVVTSQAWLGTGAAATQAKGLAVEAGGGGLDVAAENARAGSPDWRITRAGPARAIEGFADRASVCSGEVLALRVSTASASYTVSAYRMGWYGGARARLVWRSRALPGLRQAPARLEPGTRMVGTRWRQTAEVDTSGWPEGSYLLRLDALDGQAGQRFVPVTVRSASAVGRTVVVNAVATWQAYNRWGGADLYKGASGKKASRSLQVSFDRPYGSGHGAGQFLVYEAPLIALAERLGLPLAYATGVDVAREPELLRGAAAMVSLGHDEYWSPEQRRHVTAARDAGMNLAVLGANCCYRRIRFEPSAVGADRIVVCYKDDYAEDPGFRRGGPPTNDYRRAPLPDPESSLLGVIYDGYPVDAPYVVSNPDHWLLTGTGARLGDSFPHLVGVEYDRVNTAHPTPRPIEVLAHSPVVRKGRPSHADTVYFSLAGGAGVFSTGTMRWVESLDASGPGGGKAHHGLDARTARFTRTVTANVLRAFARGPAGRARPARDNLAACYGPRATIPGA
ncbi:N,N-dimethylformamidase beta subunit family domain-containing protein [Streptomyces sp. ISL-86]|uniref:N,N-dimethylformamidase beta subunit family domain-containing protein n=1 Tax=Streptomyces sp. ISL-86 TaxID=2819187 RepID=UPI0027E425B1|nr:N,N-dimethylformamidase beta subunit family domain-containing protein [Streptomyces sp. ISL-86]